MSISEIDSCNSIQEVADIIKAADMGNRESLAAYWVVDSVSDEKEQEIACYEDFMAHLEILITGYDVDVDVDVVMNLNIPSICSFMIVEKWW